MKPEKENSQFPFVSVVMPVRNEADFIAQSLRAVLAQTYPHELIEIVVADGLSTDATLELIEKIRTETDIQIKTIENPERIAPTGLNRAIRAARGEIIVRVDGHCEIEPDYVANCVKYLRAKKAEGVGGPLETIGTGITAQAIAVAMSSGFGVGGSAFRTVNDREMYVDTVAFPGYERAIFDRIGFFNEELVRNQDDEFNYRLRKAGGRILLVPDIRAKYYSRSTLKSLWRQYFQYGFWKIRVLQLHPKQMSLRQFVPFAFVAALGFLAVLAIFSSFGRWALIGFLSLYAAANLAATIKSAGRIGLRGLPIVFLSHAILHFSYGFGFCAGLIRFAGKRADKKIENSASPKLPV